MQIAAWASDDIDPTAWAERFNGRYVVVAEADQQPVGFAELASDGHIDRVYVSADWQSQGVGRQMLAALIADMLGVPLTPCEALYFSEGNVFVRVLDNVRGCDGSDPSGTPFGWTPAWENDDSRHHVESRRQRRRAGARIFKFLLGDTARLYRLVGRVP